MMRQSTLVEAYVKETVCSPHSGPEAKRKEEPVFQYPSLLDIPVSEIRVQVEEVGHWSVLPDIGSHCAKCVSVLPCLPKASSDGLNKETNRRISGTSGQS